jgi:hypothetical protein
VESCTACCLCYTGKIDGLHWSDRWTGAVRSVATAVAQQTFQEATVTSLGLGTKTTSKTQPARKENPSQSLAKQLQTSQELTSSSMGQNHTNEEVPQVKSHKGLQTNNARRSTPPNPTLDLLIHSTDSHKTLGIVGTRHGHSIARIWSTKSC